MLIGYQPYVIGSLLDEYIQRTSRGEIPPAVPVATHDSLTYYLTDVMRGDGVVDGGHHRAMAHFLLDRPLLCKSLSMDAVPSLSSEEGRIDIRDLEVEPDPDGKLYEGHTGRRWPGLDKSIYDH